jgi:hypothetical protein
MKSFTKLYRILTGLIFCTLIGQQTIIAQNHVTLDFPAKMTPYDWRFSLGYSSISMPSDIVLESSVLRWPLIKFSAQMGLPNNFIVDAMLSTEVLTNHLEVGGRWVYNINDNLHVNAEYSLAYFYGQLEQTGYDTKIHGWVSYPSLGIGYDFDGLTLTAIGAISFTNSLSSASGGVETIFNQNRYNGFYYRVSLEQPFFKNTSIGLAFQMNYFKFYYPQWALFPAIDRYYWIPEFQLWLTL